MTTRTAHANPAGRVVSDSGRCQVGAPPRARRLDAGL